MSYQLTTAKIWDGAAWVDAVGGAITPISVDYLVIAGGGSGGKDLISSNRQGCGGGAGGYRTNLSGAPSGRNSSAEPAITMGGTLRIIVGAGGSSASTSAWTVGSNSALGIIESIGGGYGAGWTGSVYRRAETGGSGGGGNETTAGIPLTFPGGGVPPQGFYGGPGASNGGGGGGGAGAEASTPSTNQGGSGGNGLANSITGSSVTRGGGGGGAGESSSHGSGGTGGGGAYRNSGTANTGGGGGAFLNTGEGNGGSGVVIFGVPTGTSVEFSAGVTQTSAVVGGNDVYTVTATSTTSETVTIG